jgi:hypothetical protein
MTAEIGESIELPLEAIGISLEEIPPFESVLVTWFEPVVPQHKHTGISNEFVVKATNYDENSRVDLPIWATGLTTGENVSRVSDRAFYLD